MVATDSIVSDCCFSIVEVRISTTTGNLVNVVPAFVTDITTVGAAAVMVVVALPVSVMTLPVTVTVRVASCLGKSINGASNSCNDGLVSRFPTSRASMVMETVVTDVEVCVKDTYEVPA